jgi:hypothetical protein
MRRYILPGCVAEAQKYLDIPALRRLARQAPQHLKMQIYFCANPKTIVVQEPVGWTADLRYSIRRHVFISLVLGFRSVKNGQT